MELTRITKLLLWLLSEETGHRGPERSRPGTGADGLGTGP